MSQAKGISNNPTERVKTGDSNIHHELAKNREGNIFADRVNESDSNNIKDRGIKRDCTIFQERVKVEDSNMHTERTTYEEGAKVKECSC